MTISLLIFRIFTVCVLALLSCACAPSTPLLQVADPIWNAGVIVTGSVHEKPVELRRGLYRTDRHHYRNELM